MLSSRDGLEEQVQPRGGVHPGAALMLSQRPGLCPWGPACCPMGDLGVSLVQTG